MRPRTSFLPSLLVAALALLPAPAAAQKGSAGPDTARVELSSGTTAFVVYPPGRKTGPAVLVVHEWWGLNGQIRGVARKLAQQGYIAIVPDLYHGRVTQDPEQAHVLLRGLEDAAVFADLDAAVAWLRASPRVGKGRVAAIGFCAGGAYTLQYAIARPELAAAIVFYGPPETDAAKLAKLSVPLQGHFGGRDEGIPAARVEALRAGLVKAGKTGEVFTYAGADHAFFNEDRPAYHADAARHAWTRALAFLQKYLKG